MSRQTLVNIETLRYYEREKIIRKSDRTQGGNKQYNHEQLKRLFFIKRCRELGFSLKEIRALLVMVDREDFSCNEVHEMTISHLSNVKKKLSDLKRLERSLREVVSECSEGGVPDCPIINNLFSIS